MPGGLSQAAVAQVIAQHLWDTGERSEMQDRLPRSLKDRVHRALQGEVCTPETLDWFIEAFGMGAEDADGLRARLYGDQPWPISPVANSLRSPGELPLPQLHRTVAVFEHRIIGPARKAVAHRTTRAITACADTVYFYPCRQFPEAARMHVVRGGAITATHYPDGSSPVLEIKLTTPLRKGQVTSLEYLAILNQSEVAIEYRQVAHARADNVDLVVQFHEAARPRRLWWTIWDAHRNGTILDQESVSLDTDACVHRYLPYLEDAVAGFRWDW